LKGEVVAVGHGTKDEEMVLKEGNTVLYGKYAEQNLKLMAQNTSLCVKAMYSRFWVNHQKCKL
jgi:co-chaperonin GroES (HSP10)